MQQDINLCWSSMWSYHESRIGNKHKACLRSIIYILMHNAARYNKRIFTLFSYHTSHNEHIDISFHYVFFNSLSAWRFRVKICSLLFSRHTLLLPQVFCLVAKYFRRYLPRRSPAASSRQLTINYTYHGGHCHLIILSSISRDAHGRQQQGQPTHLEL